MSNTDTPQGRPPQAGRYQIRLQGHLDTRWSDWFDGLTLTRESDGTTLLEGPVVDQSALHGLLQQVRDTGLPLISMTPVDPDVCAATHPTAPNPPARPPDKELDMTRRFKTPPHLTPGRARS
jgi:hypothetical protein